MFSVLPIEKVHPQDSHLIDANTLSLIKLKSASLPITPQLLIFPPELKFKETFKSFKLSGKEEFEHKLSLFTKEIKNTPQPEDLSQTLKSHHLKSQEVWDQMLDLWIKDLRNNVWQYGISKALLSPLHAKALSVSANIQSSGRAYQNPTTKQTTIQIQTGNISPLDYQNIEELIIQANKKLLIPHEYLWQKINNQIFLSQVVPWTGDDTTPILDKELQQQQSPTAPTQTATKVYLNLPQKPVIEPNLDGVVLDSSITPGFEHLSLLLAEAAISYPNHNVIFKIKSIPHILTSSILKDLVKTVLFVRNKRGLTNISVALPACSSPSQFQDLKRELATLGLNRKASLKFYLELSIPENFINLTKYIDVGLDGALINIHSLTCSLYSREITDQTFNINDEEATTTSNFLEFPLKVLHTHKLPVLLTSKTAIDDNFLNFSVRSGLTGVVANIESAPYVKEHLKFLEKRHIHKSDK